ncbi:fused MFS/spermidine synthase [Asanoa sp. WMMD1127]|uniref:spermidine synthase n=1 Tax=Asanoa sp. WMMD1127 TaxID=3016107 RepID=UPI0024160C83|nr:fused MFS/spermidine synthase [Asanoa sp. WMMD1127]MDG4823834.1 fused MFS/spermidine synthase [Asanoa sp. WMMD1127]
MGRQRGQERRVVAQIGAGVVELLPDHDRPRAWTLLVDGAPQSHVDLDDPTYLEFEYVRRIAASLDLTAPPLMPLRVLHLGGGGLTLARYLAASRPGSRQLVVEADAKLVDFVRTHLPWPADRKLRIRIGDARTELTRARDDEFDVVIVDVFAGARTPASVRSVEFVREAARVLHPDGRYLVNMTDGPPMALAKGQVATVSAVFAEAALVADSSVLRGRRFGNLVLTAANTALPTPELARRVAGDWFPGRLLAGDDLTRFASGAPVVTDADATPSAPPPVGMFGPRPEVVE